MSTVRAERLDTIRQAVNLIDSADPADLARYLTEVSVYDHLKADPAQLREKLTTADGAGPVFAAWKVSQQLLEAAGLPY